jgi:hypothetical protein
MKRLYRLLGQMLIGFAGGFLAIFFVNYFAPGKIVNTSDAIAIANTYIVFTTLIFVGFTVVLGLAGYVITQQYSSSRELNENILFDELKSKLRENDDCSEDLIKVIIENDAVKSHLTEILEAKVHQLVTDKLTEYELQTVATEFQEMRADLDMNGGKDD